MDGKILQAYKAKLTITQRQKELIIGTLLGDGNMRLPGRNINANLIIAHSANQKAYVYWKYEILKNLVLTPPRREERIYHKNPSRTLVSYSS